MYSNACVGRKRGEKGMGVGPGRALKNGAVDSGQETSTEGVHNYVQEAAIPGKGTFLAKINHNIVCNIKICASSMKRKYSSCAD